MFIVVTHSAAKFGALLFTMLPLLWKILGLDRHNSIYGRIMAFFDDNQNSIYERILVNSKIDCFVWRWILEMCAVDVFLRIDLAN